jgi:anaerobic selenocysteine-containing dehydrogenase
MKSNDASSMSVHPQDASSAGIADGGRARIVTEAGSAEVVVVLDEGMKPGTMALPNGLGLLYPDDKGEDRIVGVPVNELTSLKYQDKFVGTPFHKFVPARLEAIRPD